MNQPLLLLTPTTFETLSQSAASPHGIKLLRLRFRFGSPQCVTLGVVFRITIDLVDEMAQRPPASPPVDLRLCVTLASSKIDDSLETLKLTLQTRTVETPMAPPFHWRVDCVISTTDAVSLPLPRVRLSVACAVASPLPFSSPSSSPLAALQNFCVGSQWLPLTSDAASLALVLPVHSDDVALADVSSSRPPSPNSSRCLRVFALPTPFGRLVMEENYGHAMGAHIWDASIWLSLALIHSSSSLSSSSLRSPLGVVELGAGCGLVACVLARLSPHDLSLVATERFDALPLLNANVARNGVAASVETHELLWGATVVLLPVLPEVVVAADVLYYWSAHESLLATLGTLSLTSTTHVLIAHKRRSHAMAQRLDCVIATGVDDDCTNCTWHQWRVERLAPLGGDVDLLRLTRKL